MKKLLNDRSGFALILTILIISLLVGVTLQFNMSMELEMNSAANLRDGIKVNCAARSGFNYALAIVFEDALSTEWDSLHEAWSNPSLLASDENSSFGETQFRVRIIDHSGRININRLIVQESEEETKGFDEKQKGLLTRFLESSEFDLEEEKVGNIVNAIKDWIDPDDEVTEEEGFGAENSYYQGLSKSYSCRNAPLITIEELQLVKGITKEIFSQISKHLTVYGDGKININTADRPVLAALSEKLTNKDIDDIEEYRKDEKNDLSDVNWWKAALKTYDDDYIKDNALITTSSSYFEIKSTGFKGTLVKQVSGMVERKKGTLRVLMWKID